MSSPPSTLNAGFSPKRTALQVGGFSLIALSIIYADIGTSPLYVLNGIWPAHGPVPSKEDVIGGVSAIIWALTLLPLLKYMCVALYFGTGEGEGGSFALFQGLYPPREKDLDADRTLTGDTYLAKHAKTETFKEKARWPLLLWCLFGTALTMADGVLTPAISVTSAVGGIAIAKPDVANDLVPISVAFLLGLFFVQQFGTRRLGMAFAPVSFGWFLLLAGTGIYNITFFPGIFRAFDPSRAILLFVRTRNYSLLSGVLLAVTGCEAVFANLGQFNSASIRLSFCTFVYPGLVLAYLGQGARLVHDGEAVLHNVFYQTIPGPVNGPLYWIVFTFAVLATLIASQAMITATFSLFQQVINMKSFPPISMLYTSETVQGQVYIPAVNWALMIATIIAVCVFTDLERLTFAYGFAVATVMFSTSVLIAIHIPCVKRLPVVLGVAYLLTFGFVDALFWVAAIKKIPYGAWVPLVIGVALVMIMFLWTWAKRLEDAFDGQNRVNLRHFIQQGQDQNDSSASAVDDEKGDLYFAPATPAEPADGLHMAGTKLQRIDTCAIFHKIAEGKGVPHTFVGFLRQWPALPRVVIFLSVCVVSVPRVPLKDRYAITKVRTVSGFYGVTYYIGFRDDFDVQAGALIDQICELERQHNPAISESAVREIRVAAQTTTHIVPHYHVMSRRIGSSGVRGVLNALRRFLIEDVFRKMAQMFPETANWLTSADEIVHVGINAVI